MVAAVVLAIAGSTGYYLFAAKQKKEQQRRVAELVADTTAIYDRRPEAAKRDASRSSAADAWAKP